MDKSDERVREKPVTALHGGGGERIPGDRETRMRGYDSNRENRS